MVNSDWFAAVVEGAGGSAATLVREYVVYVLYTKLYSCLGGDTPVGARTYACSQSPWFLAKTYWLQVGRRAETCRQAGIFFRVKDLY